MNMGCITTHTESVCDLSQHTNQRTSTTSLLFSNSGICSRSYVTLHILLSASVTVKLLALKALPSLPPPPLEIQDNGIHSSSLFFVFEA